MTGTFYTKEEIKEKLPAAIQDMISDHKPGTYYWRIKEIRNNVWAIVLGWCDGFEVEDGNPYVRDDGMGLCIKLAYQPSNSAMQCDYDIDWYMPSDGADVDDTEVSLDSSADINQLVDWLFEQFDRYDETEA